MNLWRGLAFLIIAAGGCSSPLPADGAATFDPQSCLSSWRSVYSSRVNDGPPEGETFAWRNGTLFAGRSALGFDHTWLSSIPDHGGAETRLYDGAELLQSWPEGDRVLYATRRELFEVSQSGGPPRSVLRYAEALDAGHVGGRSVDDTALYWMYSDSGSRAIYRHPRSGGEDMRLAEVSPTVSGFTMAGDRLLVRGDGLSSSSAATLSKTGGAITALPTYGKSSSLAGVSRAGALLWMALAKSTNVAGNRRFTFNWARADVGGAPPQPFPTSLPPMFMLLRTWAAGDGAWYMAWFEATDPHTFYLSVWYLKADGTARRLACLPTSEPFATDPGQGDWISAAAVGDGALYVVRAHHDLSWEIVAADNPGAPPEAP
jgi:hypothetical protein